MSSWVPTLEVLLWPFSAYLAESLSQLGRGIQVLGRHPCHWKPGEKSSELKSYLLRKSEHCELNKLIIKIQWQLCKKQFSQLSNISKALCKRIDLAPLGIMCKCSLTIKHKEYIQICVLNHRLWSLFSNYFTSLFLMYTWKFTISEQRGMRNEENCLYFIIIQDLC